MPSSKKITKNKKHSIAGFFTEVSHTKDLGAFLLFGMAAFFYVVILFVPLSQKLHTSLMRNHHLANSSFTGWAFLHSLPFMYNFAHRVVVKHAPMPEDILSGQTHFSDGDFAEWYNHYPVRIITFEGFRETLTLKKEPTYFYFETRYRGDLVGTFYETTPAPEGLKMEILEPK